MLIQRFKVPSLPLSILKPANPLNWIKIIRTLSAGKQCLFRLASDNKIDHVFALWALPSGYWARNLQKESGVKYSIWSLGSDIWTLGKIPIVRNILRIVLQDAKVRFADGYILKEDLEKICDLKSFFFRPVAYYRILDIQNQSRRKIHTSLLFLGAGIPTKERIYFWTALKYFREKIG